MRPLFILFLALGLAQQQPWTPAPGNPGHQPPPEGWHCQTNTPEAPAPDGHACDCHEHTTCIKDEGTGEQVLVESPRCLVHCYKNNCRCAKKACDTE